VPDSEQNGTPVLVFTILLMRRKFLKFLILITLMCANGFWSVTFCDRFTPDQILSSSTAHLMIKAGALPAANIISHNAKQNFERWRKNSQFMCHWICNCCTTNLDCYSMSGDSYFYQFLISVPKCNGIAYHMHQCLCQWPQNCMYYWNMAELFSLQS